jgi:hypothetical protein
MLGRTVAIVRVVHTTRRVRMVHTASTVLITLFAALLGAFAPCHASIWVVDAGGGGTATTIGAAVDLAAEGDTIDVRAGTYTGFVQTGKALFFRGAGPDQTIWSGDGGACLRFVSPASAEVEDIGFTNAMTGGYGACISFSTVGGTVYVRGCSFRNSSAHNGGGISAEETNLRVDHCAFENLTATYFTGLRSGGAIYFHGSTSTLGLNACTFRSCVADPGGISTNGGGGAVSALTQWSSILDCVFEDCTAADYGGALAHTGDLTVSGCTFRRCEATRHDGGAILLGDSGNTDEIVIDGCRFESCTAHMLGGAFEGSGFLTISRCLFARNEASVGGAVRLGGEAAIRACTFYKNTGGDGGAVVVIGAFGSAILIERNILYGQIGAAILCSGGVAPVVTCNDFWDNAYGDIVDCGLGADNIFLDPRFCDAGAMEFTIDEASPCAAGNPTCPDGIGAFEVNCAVTPVRTETWGGIRLLFR